MNGMCYLRDQMAIEKEDETCTRRCMRPLASILFNGDDLGRVIESGEININRRVIEPKESSRGVFWRKIKRLRGGFKKLDPLEGDFWNFKKLAKFRKSTTPAKVVANRDAHSKRGALLRFYRPH